MNKEDFIVKRLGWFNNSISNNHKQYLKQKEINREYWTNIQKNREIQEHEYELRHKRIQISRKGNNFIKKNTDGFENVEQNLGYRLAEEFRNYNKECDKDELLISSKSSSSMSSHCDDNLKCENSEKAHSGKFEPLFNNKKIPSDDNSKGGDEKSLVEKMRTFFDNKNISQHEMQNLILKMSIDDIKEMIGKKSWSFFTVLGSDERIRYHLYYQIPKYMLCVSDGLNNSQKASNYATRKKIFDHYGSLQKIAKAKAWESVGDKVSGGLFYSNKRKRRKSIFERKNLEYGTIPAPKSWCDILFGSCLGGDNIHR